MNGRPGRGMHVHIILYYFGVFLKIENVQTYIKVEKIVSPSFNSYKPMSSVFSFFFLPTSLTKPYLIILK